ncbi:MAG: hypothetical protein AAF467_07660 [Actinomycetota bacterium]
MDTVVLYTIAIVLFNVVLILLAILTWWLMKAPKKATSEADGAAVATAPIGTDPGEVTLEGLFQFDSWYNGLPRDELAPRNGRASVSDN